VDGDIRGLDARLLGWAVQDAPRPVGAFVAADLRLLELKQAGIVNAPARPGRRLILQDTALDHPHRARAGVHDPTADSEEGAIRVGFVGGDDHVVQVRFAIQRIVQCARDGSLVALEPAIGQQQVAIIGDAAPSRKREAPQRIRPDRDVIQDEPCRTGQRITVRQTRRPADAAQ
jgi:hypothetical protein